LDLTARSASHTYTEEYREWGGGHGIGSALFWNLCQEKTVSGFDPRNVITIVSNPLAGTLTPCTGRCEVQGIGPQAYPVEWFTRSSFGGRFAAQLKYAGWDGVVIEGRAASPVWVNVVNDKVTFEDARSLWGLDTRKTQEEIWRRVTGGRYDDWQEAGLGYTTQRPAVLCIGPAGERLSRIAVLLHDGANAAGQGGFGGVFGAKNLKAISVRGTGGVFVADPKGLIESWLWHRSNFQYNVDAPKHESPRPNFPNYWVVNYQVGGVAYLSTTEPCRPHACQSCPTACRRRSASGLASESKCMSMMWPRFSVRSCEEGGRIVGPIKESTADMEDLAALARGRHRLSDDVQLSGLNAYELLAADTYLMNLHNAGVLGPHKAIDCGLPFERWDSAECKHDLIRMIAYREGIGDALAEGLPRAAEKWGRYQQDTNNGLLEHPNWGYWWHYDPRVEVEWSYGSILGERDINEHGGINLAVHNMPLMAKAGRIEPIVSAERVAEILATKVLPYEGDPFMFDYSEGPTGIYSANRAKTIAWHRHYTRFWTEAMGNCALLWPSFINTNAPDLLGATPQGEVRFLNAVTGEGLSFVDGMEKGRRIWNLDRAIWVLQGRHRDMEVFSGYVYSVPVSRPHPLPVYEDGEWRFSDNIGRRLNKIRFEEWKTKYFELEGWESASGWPTRDTLEKLSLGKIADELERAGRLGMDSRT